MVDRPSFPNYNRYLRPKKSRAPAVLASRIALGGEAIDEHACELLEDGVLAGDQPDHMRRPVFFAGFFFVLARVAVSTFFAVARFAGAGRLPTIFFGARSFSARHC